MARLGTIVMARLAPTCLAPDGRHGPGWSANPSTEQWSIGSGNARPVKTWVRLPDAQAPGRWGVSPRLFYPSPWHPGQPWPYIPGSIIFMLFLT